MKNNLPIDLVLVRHGHSEQNEAYEASLQGDPSLYTQEYRRRPDRNHRLTPQGVAQARTAGEWLRSQFEPGFFDRFFVSTYDRAQQTAANLALPGARWEIKRTLIERSWGDYGHLPVEEQMQKYADHMQRARSDAFFSRPPNGDSMNDVCNNIGAMLMSWRQTPVGERVIMVTHGEVMTGMRYVFEHMDHYRWFDMMESSDPTDKTHNCQIIHYTRRNPDDAGDVREEFRWVRSVCPWDLALSSNVWIEVPPASAYTDAQLLAKLQQNLPK